VIELWRYRGLLWQWTLRTLLVRYKQTLLGVLWAFMVPAFTVVVLSVVFARSTSLSVDTGAIPYPLFVYVGLIPWQFFQSSLSLSVTSIVSQKHLIPKIYFPRAILPLSTILASFVDMVFSSLALVALFVYYSVPLHPIALLAIPLLLLQVVFMAGCGLLLSMGAVFFQDVEYLFKMVVMVWMFGSSVIYPIKLANPRLQALVELNPMTPILDGYRSVLILGRAPDPWVLLRACAIVLLVVVVSFWAFRRLEPQFPEVI
jgi:ABC-type polysaccharide/polyol phosphate export permease